MGFSVAPEPAPANRALSFSQISPSLPCGSKVRFLEEKPAKEQVTFLPPCCPHELHTLKPACTQPPAICQLFNLIFLPTSMASGGFCLWEVNAQASGLRPQKVLLSRFLNGCLLCRLSSLSISNLSRFFLVSVGGASL